MAPCQRIQGTIYMIYYSYSFNVTNIENKYMDDSTKYEQLSLKARHISEKKSFNLLFGAESCIGYIPCVFSTRSSSRHHRKSPFNRLMLTRRPSYGDFVLLIRRPNREVNFFLQHQRVCDSSSDFFL